LLLLFLLKISFWCGQMLNKKYPKGNKSYDPKRKSVMEPRFIWLLEQMCLNSNIDQQEIDLQLDFWENKEEIENRFGVKLSLTKKDDSIDWRKWEAQLAWYNDQIGVKKGRKTDKKVPVDISNIMKASGYEI
jgi:hypothetical protein